MNTYTKKPCINLLPQVTKWIEKSLSSTLTLEHIYILQEDKNDHNIIFMTLTIITDDMYKALLELFKHFFLTIEMNMIQSVWVTSPIMELSLWKVHETCKAI